MRFVLETLVLGLTVVAVFRGLENRAHALMTIGLIVVVWLYRCKMAR